MRVMLRYRSTAERSRGGYNHHRMTSHLSVIVGDITSLNVDAIVNAANEKLARGAGVCATIFRAAGPQLADACAEQAPCRTGEARITPGFNAKARWIIHAVGPMRHGGNRNEALLLEFAYLESLRLAEHRRSIHRVPGDTYRYLRLSARAGRASGDRNG